MVSWCRWHQSSSDELEDADSFLHPLSLSLCRWFRLTMSVITLSPVCCIKHIHKQAYIHLTQWSETPPHPHPPRNKMKLELLHSSSLKGPEKLISCLDMNS